MFFCCLISYLNIIDYLCQFISSNFFHRIYELIKSNDFQFGLTFLGIVTTWIVTFITIRNVNKNTNLQIQSQNKISYRPYLKVVEIKSRYTSEALISYTPTAPKNNNEYENMCCAIIKIKNVGNGIATDFKIIDISDDFKVLHNDMFWFSNNYDRSQSFDNSDEIGIEKNGDFKFKLFLKYGVDSSYEKDFLFIYRAIDMNVYGFKITIYASLNSETIVYNVSENMEYKIKSNISKEEVYKNIKDEYLKNSNKDE